MISAPFIPALQPKEIWKQGTFLFFPPKHPEVRKCTDVCEAIHPLCTISLLFIILKLFFSPKREGNETFQNHQKTQSNLHLQDQHQSLELLVHSRAVIFKEKKKKIQKSFSDCICLGTHLVYILIGSYIVLIQGTPLMLEVNNSQIISICLHT